MNLNKKIALALAALFAVSAGIAQETAPAGLLGQRYAETSLSLVDVPGTSTNGYDIGFAVNLPATPIVDVSFAYDYDWIKVGSFKAHDHTLATTAKVYSAYEGVKPFLAIGVGYEWSTVKVAGLKASDDQGVWGTGLGVEVPFKGFILTPTISYVDSFESGNAGSYQYALEGSRWFTPAVNGFAKLEFDNTVGNGGQVWTYQVGVRLKF